MKEAIKKFFHRHKTYILAIAVLGIFIDIFLLAFTSGLVTLFLIGLWLLATWLYQIRGRVLVIPAIIFLILSPWLTVRGEEAVADRMAVWVFIFLTLGILQELFGRRE